jgi:hypothetical protein
MSFLLTRVGTIPVAVTAIGNCHAVQVRPLQFPNHFLIYDVGGELMAPIQNDAYIFRAPAAFAPGEVVGFVGVAAENGTLNFEIEDLDGTQFLIR